MEGRVVQGAIIIGRKTLDAFSKWNFRFQIP